MLAGTGALASRDSFAPADAHSSLATWLLALALACAIAELFVRARRRDVERAAVAAVARKAA
jgi:hypothetical protein